MGAPRAGHLLAAGHTLFVHTRRARSPAPQAAGALACASATEVAQRADIVFLMLPDRLLEVHGERMVKRSFDPGFRIALHQNDLNLALRGAKAMGLALPQSASAAGAAQSMQICAVQGWDQVDHSALVKSLELLAAHPVAQG